MNEKFQMFPVQASTMASRVDNLMLYLLAVTVFFSVAIAVVLIFFAVRYRKRSESDVTPAIHGSTLLEITWTAIPLGLVVVMFFWGANVYFDQMYAPANSMEVFVTAKQWMWKFQHPNGKREINELHVPAGRPVKLIMASEDVIHDFFVPDFRVKMDVMPGKYNTTWFHATKTGEFHLFCNQYCGEDHSRMVGKIVVMNPEDYEVWLSGGTRNESPAATGERLFTQWACNTCHEGGRDARGPNLAGVPGRNVILTGGVVVVADDTYLRDSILNPAAKVVDGYQPIMPTFKGLLSEDQVMSLIAYIKTLDDTATDTGTKATTGTAAGFTAAPAPSPTDGDNSPSAEQADATTTTGAAPSGAPTIPTNPTDAGTTAQAETTQ